MNINYDLKAKVIELGFDAIQREVSKSLYYHLYPNPNYQPPLLRIVAMYCEAYFSRYYPKEWEEAKKVNHALYERTCRLKHFIKGMLKSGDCLFLTLTFTDKVLKSTTPKTRRTYVSRWLKSYDTSYVANKDFGAKKGREHYHSVLQKDFVDYKTWKYGRIDGEKIKSNEDAPQLSKYVAKLTNHAIKETTKRSTFLYSRCSLKNKKSKIDFDNIELIEDSPLVYEEEYYQDCLF